MTWNTPPAVSTGGTWRASDQNTYVKDNLEELFPYTSGMQVAYSTSSTTLAKSNTGAALQVLMANAANTEINFTPIIYARQGNSTSNWFSTASTSTALTNYTPVSPFIQCGATYVPASSTVTVVFPIAYTNIPVIVFGADAGGNLFIANTITSTGFKIIGTSGADFASWIAMGE